MADETVQWYAMRAYKNENRAEQDIAQAPELECFVARRYELRVYHGKKHRKLVPLIPSLVFVRGRQADIQQFKIRHPSLQYICNHFAGEASQKLVVPDKQMADFMKVAEQHEADVRFISVAEVALQKGCRVKIIGGIFDGVEGVLVRDKELGSSRVAVALPGNLGAISTTEVTPEFISVLD